MSRLTVAIDIDGVLADYSEGWKGVEHFGPPTAFAVELTKQIAEFADIIIFSCRLNDDLNKQYTRSERFNLVVNWLNKHGIIYHHIWTEQGKPYAKVFIDDRAVFCNEKSELSQILADVTARLNA